MARRSAESHPAAFGPTIGGADRHGLCRAPLRRARHAGRAVVRDKELAAKVVALPFVPHRYIRG